MKTFLSKKRYSIVETIKEKKSGQDQLNEDFLEFLNKSDTEKKSPAIRMCKIRKMDSMSTLA